MSWDITRSRARVQKLMGTVPQSVVAVGTFDANYLRQRQTTVASAGRKLFLDEAAIVNIPTTAGVLVDGVHVYVQLIDYHDTVGEAARETEASHRRLLRFLHLHYAAADRVAASYDAQRVDFHGPRLHAVVVTPTGPDMERERLVRALEMAATLKATIEEAGAQFPNQQLGTRVRIGIDTGLAVAVNSGRGGEPEPLFLGRPANYAAKLAEGTQPGIYLSDRARAVLAMPRMGSLMAERASAISPAAALASTVGPSSTATGAWASRKRIDETLAQIQGDANLVLELTSDAVFRFHHHEPPLSGIKFADLMPSNSIRMGMVSVFADLDGFTAYVDQCLAGGRVAEMVANLHVIRGELAAVIRDDFRGRKVRFIGDCVHGIIASGDRLKTDRMETVTQGVRLAGGLRSSFDLCRDLLPGVQGLGLAIGLELGETPVTRLGIRGGRSVRCASSRAVSSSETLQQDCDGRQTSLGRTALAEASARIRKLFAGGPVRDLDYDTVEVMVSGLDGPKSVAAPPAPAFRAHAQG